MDAPEPERPAPCALPLACAVGAAALLAQTVLVRELMVSFYGTEPALAAALGGWLLFLPLGALVSAGLLRVLGRGELALLWAALTAMALGLPAQFLLARLVRPLLGAQTGEFLPIGSVVAGALIASFPVAFAAGFAFPAAARAQERLARRPAGGIGAVYVAEALGSGAAGAALSFILLGRVPAAGLVLAAAAGISLLLAWWSRAGGGGGRAGVALLLGLGGLVALVGWGGRIEEATSGLRWRTFTRFERLAGLQTRYQHVELGRRAGEYVLVQDGQIGAQFPDPAAAARLSALVLTQHPRPESVLVIGGGLTGLCQRLLAAPVARVDCAEPDPRLIAFLLARLPAALRRPLDDPRFSAYACDGRYLVSRAAIGAAMEGVPVAAGAARPPLGAYDLVVVNVGDPASAAAGRFFTVEFCREIAGVLRPGGAVAFCGLTGSDNYVPGGPALAYAACLHRTLGAEFRRVVARPGSELGFFASIDPGAVSSDPAVLARRFEAMGLTPEPLKHAFRLEEFPPERTEHLRDLLRRAAPDAPANADGRPALFTLFLELQAHYAGPGREGGRTLESPGRGLWTRLRRAPLGWLVLPPAALLVAVVALRFALGRARSLPWACGLAIFTTGTFGLAAEMLIVYGYQAQFGYVYRDIAVIVGLFMLGLALGGWLSTHGLAGGPARALPAAECAQAVLLLALPALCAALAFSPAAFILLSPLAGLLTGCEFPLAARASLACGAGAGTVAGAFDAADHLGALLGAAVAGLLLVPALGLAQTGALLALLKCVSAVGLLLAAPPRGATT